MEETAYTIIGRAIREHFRDDEEKMRVPWSRQMAQIIDDGFLDGILGKSEELIRNNQLIADRIIQEAQVWERSKRSMENEVRLLEERKARIGREIEALKVIREEEPDPVLQSAKRAYAWMLSQTGDKQLAAKAFNSYLLGRKEELPCQPTP